MDIWKHCPRNRDVDLVEQRAEDFLKRFGVQDKVSLKNLEEKLYLANSEEQEMIINNVLEHIKGGTIKDLQEFDLIFRQQLAAHIPQKALGGQSPVKYALFLKKMKEGKI